MSPFRRSSSRAQFTIYVVYMILRSACLRSFVHGPWFVPCVAVDLVCLSIAPNDIWLWTAMAGTTAKNAELNYMPDRSHHTPNFDDTTSPYYMHSARTHTHYEHTRWNANPAIRSAVPRCRDAYLLCFSFARQPTTGAEHQPHAKRSAEAAAPCRRQSQRKSKQNGTIGKDDWRDAILFNHLWSTLIFSLVVVAMNVIESAGKGGGDLFKCIELSGGKLKRLLNSLLRECARTAGFRFARHRSEYERARLFCTPFNRANMAMWSLCRDGYSLPFPATVHHRFIIVVGFSCAMPCSLMRSRFLTLLRRWTADTLCSICFVNALAA